MSNRDALQTTDAIRASFLEFFKQQGHTIVPGASLIPKDDPTLLFVNAGMVPFKRLFLGQEKRDYEAACSSQPCIRAGGKHNDLDNVGYTARHHTFFEMLGNFSFGAYFKEKAIDLAWAYLTGVLALPKDRLWVTVFHDDQDSYDYWVNHIGVPEERMVRCGEKDNFWSMGDIGPCGPCTEVFYDHGPSIAGGPPGSADEDGDRYIEIWNLVFMQYDRQPDGSLQPLPKPCVDTGMGLERIAAVLQHVNSNYDIDLFHTMIQAIASRFNLKDLASPSLRVLADHLRSVCFLILDGIVPGNEGRAYVLRRILRRAIRHGHTLGITGLFFHGLVDDLIAVMGDAYPDLSLKSDYLKRIILNEEEQFSKTLNKGMQMLNEAMEKDQTILSGELVFTLYDTYGFPPDLTADVARERGICIDQDGFNQCMAAQKQRSRQSSGFAALPEAALGVNGSTDFQGYDHLCLSSSVREIYLDGIAVERLESTEEQAIVILDQTSFYAESGGQVGDQGFLQWGSGCFEVIDTQKQGDVILHTGFLKEGSLAIGEVVQAKVDQVNRLAIAANHSATHLLHAVLRAQLGDTVVQKGSLVDATRLRFDFSHGEPLSAQQLLDIEEAVNAYIRMNEPTVTQEGTLEDAKANGVMALFGEKYADVVRSVHIGSHSYELCGGTHVERTGDIGLFKITQETACSAGVRRIEAVTGSQALRLFQHQASVVTALSRAMNVESGQLLHSVEGQSVRLQAQEKTIDALKYELVQAKSGDIAQSFKQAGDMRYLLIQCKDLDRKAMMQQCDAWFAKHSDALICMVSEYDSEVLLLAKLSQQWASILKAGDLIKAMCASLGGRGGGKPTMAQGGAKTTEHLDKAMAIGEQLILDSVNA